MAPSSQLLRSVDCASTLTATLILHSQVVCLLACVWLSAVLAVVVLLLSGICLRAMNVLGCRDVDEIVVTFALVVPVRMQS